MLSVDENRSEIKFLVSPILTKLHCKQRTRYVPTRRKQPILPFRLHSPHKIDICIQERFNTLIYSINTIIKCVI